MTFGTTAAAARVLRRLPALLLALAACLALAPAAYGQTTIQQETFETDGEGTRYDAFDANGSISTFTDGSGDYFTRTDGSTVGGTYNSPEASFFFAGQDVDGEGDTPPLRLQLASVSTSGFTGLTVRALFAEDDDGGNQDWDSSDYVRLQYSTDGGSTFTDLICFAGDGSAFNSEPGIDSNCDGTRDAAGTSLTDTFTEFTGSIPGTPASVILRVEAQLDAGDEDFAVDNIRLEGTGGGPTGTDLAIAPDNADQNEGDSGATAFTFTVTRSGDLSGATDVDFAVTGSGANPADAADFGGALPSGTVSFAANDASETITVSVTGDATAEPDETFTVTLSNPSGSATITTATADGTIRDDDTPAPAVVINEVDADTPGTDDAEYVELAGPANTPLDGLVLVFFNGSNDASYEAFDLDGETTDANGFFVLCGDATNVANCDLDVTPDQNLIQNGADAVALYQANASDFPTGTAPTTTNLLSAVVYDTNDSDDAGLLTGLGETTQYDEDANGSGDTQSLQRQPDDSFAALAPTAGAANAAPVPAISFVTTTQTIAEDAASPTVTLTLEIQGADGTAVDVAVALTGGTGTANDFTPAYTTQTVSFPAGAVDGDQETLTVDVENDTANEGTETFDFSIQDDTDGDALPGPDDTFTLTITDDDVPVISTLPFLEDFEGGFPGTFSPIDVAGTNDVWGSTSFSGDTFASVNGFENSGPAEADEDWLISPAFDLSGTTDEVLVVRTAERFAGPDLELLFSTDYDGTSTNPGSFTWNPVGATATPFPEDESNGSFVFTSFASTFDVSGTAFDAGPLYFAFRYTADGTSGGSQDWKVDDFLLQSRTVENVTAGTTFFSIQDAVNAASAGDVIRPSAGLFAENVAVTEGVRLEGPATGTATVDGSNDQAAAAVSIEADDVTITGLQLGAASLNPDELTLAGVTLIGELGVTNYTGATITGNTIIATAAGVAVREIDTTPGAFTISGNAITLATQIFDIPTGATLPGVPFAGDADNIAGNDQGEQSAGIALVGILGTQAPTISANAIAGAYLGYSILGFNPAGAVIEGGATPADITGAVIGFFVPNNQDVDGDGDGDVFQPNVFDIEGFVMTGFTGGSPLEAVNFHTGVFSDTNGNDSNPTPDDAVPVLVGIGSVDQAVNTITVRNTIIDGVSFPTAPFDNVGDLTDDERDFSGALAIGDFSGDDTEDVANTVTVEGSTLSSSANRGATVTGANATLTITGSDLTDNGAASEAGFGAAGIVAESSGTATLSGVRLVNPSTSSTAVTGVRAAGGGTATIAGSLLDNGDNVSGTLTAGAVNASGNVFLNTGAATALLIEPTEIVPLVSSATDYTPWLVDPTNDAASPTGFQGRTATLGVDAGSPQPSGARLAEAAALGGPDAVLRVYDSSSFPGTPLDVSAALEVGSLLAFDDLTFTGSGPVTVRDDLGIGNTLSPSSFASSPTFATGPILRGTAGMGNDTGWYNLGLPADGTGADLADDYNAGAVQGAVLFTYDPFAAGSGGSQGAFVPGDLTNATTLNAGQTGFWLYFFDDITQPIQPSTPILLDVENTFTTANAPGTTFGAADKTVDLFDTDGDGADDIAPPGGTIDCTAFDNSGTFTNGGSIFFYVGSPGTELEFAL